MTALLLWVACTGPDTDPADTDTGWPDDTDTDTDVEETDTDTDPVDTDTDPVDTDTDPVDTDTDDTDIWEDPCIPVEPAERWFVEAPRVLRGPNPDAVAAGTTHVQVVDLLGRGRDELLVSDATADTVTWLRDCTVDGCVAQELPGPFVDPGRTAQADMNGDGFMDVVVADVGNIFPDFDPVGVVRVLYGDGAGGFSAEVAVDMIGRTACAQPADLDGDADLDLVVCEFGTDFGGGLWWYEQTPDGWTRHALVALDGAVDAWAVDLDGDGDLDIASNISGVHETVMVWLGDGAGTFTRTDDAYVAGVSWYGMSGLRPVDLDRDGDLDLVLTNGDTLDVDLPASTHPADHYGTAWLENDGRARFAFRDIQRSWGAYTTRARDLDGDCDVDLVVRRLQEPTLFPAHVERDPDFLETLVVDPLSWLEGEEGAASFTPHSLEGVDGGFAFGVEVADLDNDGVLDVITGPFDLASDPERARVQWWRGQRTVR